MGQKVNPIGFRTGVVRGWQSRWYASKQEFAGLLLEDKKIKDRFRDAFDETPDTNGSSNHVIVRNPVALRVDDDSRPLTGAPPPPFSGHLSTERVFWHSKKSSKKILL